MTGRRDEYERQPQGETGVEPFAWHRGKTRKGEYRIEVPDLADLLAYRYRPWILVLWEPLRTKAPGPHLARPYCCYADTVIFYCGPSFYALPPKRYLSWYEYDGSKHGNGNPRLVRLVRPVIRKDTTGSFAEHDRIEHRLRHDDHVRFDGEVWHLSGGGVRWRNLPGQARRWWMVHTARRARADDRCGGCAEVAVLTYRCIDCGALVQWDDERLRDTRSTCPHCSARLVPAEVPFALEAP